MVGGSLESLMTFEPSLWSGEDRLTWGAEETVLHWGRSVGGEGVEEANGKKQQGGATAERPLWASPNPLLTTCVKPPLPQQTHALSGLWHGA